MGVSAAGFTASSSYGGVRCAEHFASSAVGTIKVMSIAQEGGAGVPEDGDLEIRPHGDELCGTKGDVHARDEEDRGGDLGPVDDGAVGGVEVLQEEAAIVKADLEVLGGDDDVLQGDVTGRGAAYSDGRFVCAKAELIEAIEDVGNGVPEADDGGLLWFRGRG